MVTASSSVWVDRSPEDLFAYCAVFENATTWQEDVIRSEQTSDGEPGLGSTGIYAQKLLGREVENHVEIAAYDPPASICWQTTSGPISFYGCQTFEEQEGGTLVTMSAEIEGAGFFKVAEGMLKNQAQSGFDRDLANFKALMEG